MNDDLKDFLSVIAYIYLQNQKIDRALLLLKALSALYPSDAKIGISLCYAYLLGGQYNEALYETELWLVMSNPGSEEKGLLELIKSRILLGLGDREGAMAVMRSSKMVGRALNLPGAGMTDKGG